MGVYLRTLELLESYYGGKSWKRFFLEGGCYWLASFLQKRISGSYLVINKCDEHCALCINGKIYDVTGRVSSKNFRVAREREISYMRKNYKPKFDVYDLYDYLEQNL